MIITCPNCDTKYQVTQKAIGSAGRKVQCAHCQESWQAVAEPEPEAPKPKLVEDPTPKRRASDENDNIFSEDDEAALDSAFEAEASQNNDDAELDKGIQSSRKNDMLRRQLQFAQNLPIGRIRTNLRIIGFALICVFVTGAAYFKTEIVRRVPELAAVYEAVGMDVNVLGLEFRDIKTLRALQNGNDVMIISGRIQNITSRQVKVPPVEVSIMDASGTSLYSWSVTPDYSVIGTGEILNFETQLASAPMSAHSVMLVFADGRAN